MKHDRTGGKRTNWLLIKHRDEHAREGDADAVLAEDRSIASGRPMAAIAAGKGRGPKPFILAGKANCGAGRRVGQQDGPCCRESQRAQGWLGQDKVTDVEGTATFLCCASGLHSAPALRAGRAATVRRWLGTRIKFDGYRIQLRVQNEQVTLKTRKGLDWTGKFGAIAREAKSLPDAIIDGEIVASTRTAFLISPLCRRHCLSKIATA